MLHSLFRAGLAMGLFGLLLVPGIASAQDKRGRHVQDDAHLFKKAAIDEANAVIAKIHDKHHKELFIETVKEGPDKADKDAETSWARERFNEYKIDGVYVVFCKKPKFYRIEVGNKTRADGYFGTENIKELRNIIESKQTAEEMLERIANYTFDTMNKHVAAPVPQPKAKQQAPVDPGPAPPAPVARGGEHHTDWLSIILPWVCVIAVAALVIWVIFAIIRALTGMGGGGYGYGGGGMMGGGGGGGFFTGMLGGLFGAMAGMWIYNSFFGGHATYGADGNVNWGGGSQGDAGYSGDTDTGASGGGDNWGGGDGDDGADAGGGKGGDDDAGGGKGGDDDAGGGGDWGGGGGGNDAGGGGDWGGGGDAGGGGGDWGGGGDAGGGGDDWGGGGGDFGGGGGGCGGGGGGDW